MGKFLYYIVLLVFTDLLFSIFINPVDVSLLGAIWTAISILIFGGSWSQLSTVLTSGLFIATTIASTAIVATGVVLSRVAGSGVNVETFIWTSIATAFMINLGADFIVIFRILESIHRPLSTILALIIMAPVITVFFFTVLEWVRNKD